MTLISSHRWWKTLPLRTWWCRRGGGRWAALARDQLLHARRPDLKFYKYDQHLSFKIVLNPGPIMFSQRFFFLQLLAYVLGECQILLLLAQDMQQRVQNLYLLGLICLFFGFSFFFMRIVPLFLAMFIDLGKVIERRC